MKQKLKNCSKRTTEERELESDREEFFLATFYRDSLGFYLLLFTTRRTEQKGIQRRKQNKNTAKSSQVSEMADKMFRLRYWQNVLCFAPNGHHRIWIDA